MNIQTDKQVVVFRKDGQYGTNYSISLSRKDKEGKYCNAYIPVKFKNGELEDKAKIYIKNAFLSFYLKQDKMPIFYIMIMDYETIDKTIEKSKEESISTIEQEKIEQADLFAEFANENTINESELPF